MCLSGGGGDLPCQSLGSPRAFVVQVVVVKSKHLQEVSFFLFLFFCHLSCSYLLIVAFQMFIKTQILCKCTSVLDAYREEIDSNSTGTMKSLVMWDWPSAILNSLIPRWVTDFKPIEYLGINVQDRIFIPEHFSQIASLYEIYCRNYAYTWCLSGFLQRIFIWNSFNNIKVLEFRTVLPKI